MCVCDIFLYDSNRFYSILSSSFLTSFFSHSVLNRDLIFFTIAMNSIQFIQLAETYLNQSVIDVWIFWKSVWTCMCVGVWSWVNFLFSHTRSAQSWLFIWNLLRLNKWELSEVLEVAMARSLFTGKRRENIHQFHSLTGCVRFTSKNPYLTKWE